MRFTVSSANLTFVGSSKILEISPTFLSVKTPITIALSFGVSLTFLISFIFILIKLAYSRARGNILVGRKNRKIVLIRNGEDHPLALFSHQNPRLKIRNKCSGFANQ